MPTIPRLLGAVCGLVLAASLFTQAYAEDATALHAALAIERARPVAPAFPRGAFLLRPAVRDVSLSPDGRHLAYSYEQRSNRAVWLLDTAGGEARPLLSHSDARELYWSHDGRWLLLESPRQVFAVAVDGQSGSGVVTVLGGAARSRVLSVDPVQPAALLLVEKMPAGRWQLWRVDVAGHRTLLHEDPGQITGAAFDSTGKLAFLSRVDEDRQAIDAIDTAGESWELAHCTQLDGCFLLPVTNGQGEALLRGNFDGNLSRLLRLDARGAAHTIHADPDGVADIYGIDLDPVSGRPLIVGYAGTRVRNHGLTADVQAQIDGIERHFPQRDLSIGVARGERAYWLVGETASSAQDERWHLYDPRSGQFHRVLDTPPLRQRGGTVGAWLPEQALAPKIPFDWRASDGMRLHGFISVPPGMDPARLPLVVSVHGGPWNLVRPDFDVVVQFLVNRGYAVFEPNFRGSTGYGHDYMAAAHGDFGNGRVQQDIVEGTRYLLAQGIGDAQRVGITGASFGGYSALLGVTFEPELFKVAVAGVPPTDFSWLLRWIERGSYASTLCRYLDCASVLRKLTLDTSDGALMERLHAQSPLANAARLQRPVLLLAGGDDRRVAIRGVIEYASILKLLGKDVSLLVDPRAGHTTDDALAREAYLYLLEQMLQRHLGGAAPAPPDAALADYLERNLVMAGRAAPQAPNRPASRASSSRASR
jgi:dipeptidyl aminopeptidase/acylaminoacyl peptidase